MDNSTYQQIELRAYQLWESRGHPLGTPDVDWFQAEQELTTPLIAVAREVGATLGTVVAFLGGS